MTEADATSPRQDQPAEVQSSLPVDPLRLMAGLWKRRKWVLFSLLAGVALGLGLGLLKAKTRYKANVQLIKRDLPSAFRIGETGEAFKPRQLSGGTLVGAAGAAAVLQRVAAKSSLSQSELQSSIEVAEQRNTDFVFLTFSGFKSAAETANVANLWANEVVQFTRELQCQESREIRQFLQTQVDATDAELRKLREQILEFTKREDLVDADKQITSYLSSLGEVDLKYQTARIGLETLNFKIKGVEAELHRQSPLADKLRAAQSELEDLRSQYTDKNPVIVEKLAKVKALEEQVKQAEANSQADSSTYAGTFLGNTLYLELVQLQNEAKAVAREAEEYDKLRTQERAKLNAIPEKAAAFAQLGLRKQSLEIARNLLFSRLREAQLFEENSPGYYRVFSPASADRIEVRSKLTKTAIFTVGGGAFFAFVSLLAALVMELLDPMLRTPWEAAKVFRAPLLGSLPKTGASSALGFELWARWVGAERTPGRPRIVWSPSPGEDEQLFWNLLFERASSLLPSLRVIDCGSMPLPPSAYRKVCIERIDAENFSIAEAQQLGGQICESCRGGSEVWIRLAGPVHEPLTTIGRCGQPALVLVRLHAEETEFWKTQGELLAKTIAQPAGVVSVGEISWRDWA
ncbi:MAG: hypothetical protein WCP06_03725 [Verrucomicrobiota bacterium]